MALNSTQINFSKKSIQWHSSIPHHLTYKALKGIKINSFVKRIKKNSSVRVFILKKVIERD